MDSRGIWEQEICPVQIGQRPWDLQPTALAHPGHCTVTLYWQSTKRKLFTLEISPGKWEHTSRTQWPTTKATPFLITGLFHRVINLFRKLLGSRLLDSSPLVPAEQAFTGRAARVIRKSTASQKSWDAQGEPRWQKPLECRILPDLRGAGPFITASSSLSEALIIIVHFLLRNILAMTLYCNAKIGMSFQENL